MDSTSGIYKITCLGTEGVYIGSTNNFDRRWHEHRLELKRGDHKNKALQNMWDKYGEVTFDFTVIEVVKDQEQLYAREQHWLDTTDYLINISLVAEGSRVRGRTISAKTRAKISATLMGRKTGPKSAETVDRMRAAPIGKKASPKARQAMSEAAKKRRANPELKQKLSSVRKGQKHGPMSDETKEKLRQVALAQQQDPAYRAKQQAAVQEKMQDPEVRARMIAGQQAALARKGGKLSAEHRAAIGAATKGKKRSEETKRKQSEARKAFWAKRKSQK